MPIVPDDYHIWFQMYAAALRSHLDICQWLFEYGGGAKYQINKETIDGNTPLKMSYAAWLYGKVNDGKTCRWLLQNGGGQHLNSVARSHLQIKGTEETNSNHLVIWMRETIQLDDTFILFMCGATSSELSGVNTRQRKRKRKMNPERSLQILDGHPGIMELIGNYAGFIRGKEFRMLQEFNTLVIQYNNTYHGS